MNRPDRPGVPRKHPREQQPTTTASKAGPKAAAQTLVWTWSGAGLLVLAGLVFYSNTFTSPFVFDDKGFFNVEKRLQHIWPPLETVKGSIRPVVDFTFALNFAVGGWRFWTFHALNLAIHLAAALLLYGLIRRTLSRGSLGERYGKVAWGLALTTALLWLVHPLQTESVTYVFQRFESLMGLFFIATFYCFVRAQDSRWPVWWYAGSVASFLLAVGCKEVSIAIPPLLVWYDRAFLAPSWREMFRKRWPFYVSLVGVLGVLGALVFYSLPKYAGGGMLVVKGVSPLGYALTQPGVILHYLRLTVWPQGQCLDYGWPVATTAWQIVPPLLVVLAMMGATVWCIWRHPALGFLGGCFFLILAPSSSFIPIRDLAFEHRMYLPLAAVLMVLVLGAYELIRRVLTVGTTTPFERFLIQAVPVLVITVVLGSFTLLRNQVYSSEIAIWQDIVAKSPNNARGYGNLGLMFMLKHDSKTAEAFFRHAIELKPDYYDAHYNLALVLTKKKNREEAIKHYEVAVKGDAWFIPLAHCNLASLLMEKGEMEEARRHCEIALKMEPKNPTIQFNYANSIAASEPDRAIKVYEQLLLKRPGDPGVTANLADTLLKLGRRGDAIRVYRQALNVYPNSAGLNYRLATLLPEDDPEAIRLLEIVVYEQPRFAKAHVALGNRLEGRGQLREAAQQYRMALAIDPKDPVARARLKSIVRVLSKQASQ